MSNIEPCLEIDPSKFVFVIGPSFTRTVLQELNSYANSTDISSETAANTTHLATANTNSPTFELSNIVTQGVGVLLETENFQSEEEKQKCEVRYKNAYELDPLFAYRKVAANLQKTGRYADWLKRSFEVHVEPTHTSPSLLHLVQLQKKGALLLYVHCDDVLSKVSKTSPILLEDMEGLELWFRGEKDGFLHVHGVYWEPYTVKLDCEIYDNQAHQLKPATERLKQVFDERQTIMIGFDQHADDPLLSKFLEKYITFAGDKPTQQSFHFAPNHATSNLLPCLPISPAIHNGDMQITTWHPPVNGQTISTLTESSLSLWKQIEFPVYKTKDNNMMSLLVVGKQGAVEISRMMFVAPGVNFALVSSVQYGPHFINTVSIRVESAKLKELWLWMLQSEKDLLLSKGLLAIVMDSGTFVWLKGKPMTGLKPVVEEVLTGEIPSDREAAGEVPMDTALPASEPNSNMKSILAHKGKSVSPLVGPEFTLPSKGTTRKKPRYTVHKFRVKQAGGSINMNINGIGSLRKHQKHSYDDNAVLSTQASLIPKSVFARRCSLPPNVATGSSGTDDSMDTTTLGVLAENLHSTNPQLSPPTYAAIKQALLTDKFKRRPSMQTDPKMLKNLLQSKLIISEKQELLSQRRNSDPGLYLKQSDFKRRKELFVDENKAWASTFSSIIEKKIQKWQKKRQERQYLAWKNGEMSPRGVHNLHLLNSQLAQQQGLLNPLQQTLANGVSATSANSVQTLLASNYATAAAAGMGMSPFIFPQTVYTSTTSASAAGTATPSMFYGASPFITPYTFVNPYTTALQLGQLGQQPTAYYIPQTGSTAAGQNLFYFIPSTTANATTTTLQQPQQQPQTMTQSEPSESRSASSNSSISSSTPTTSSNIQQQLPQLSSLIAPNPRIIQPLRTSTSSISSSDSERAPDRYEHHPISPNSRKRHQSVPEKLTSLLQVPTPSIRSASPSLEEDNIESPPSVKKQRSTSDTTVYYTPYGYTQLSPHRGVSPQRNSTSPQPPVEQQQGLSPLQTHLLQVHSIPPTERRRKHGHSHSPRSGSSPRRHQELMQGQVQEMDEQEAEDIVGGALQSAGQQKELPVPAPRSSLQLWQFLLELLLISANTHLIQWTDSEFEFQINKPSEVAQLWGQVTNNPTMNYEKLARGLRYYYSRGIMNKVPGKKLTFKYAGNVRNYVQMRKSQMLSTHEEVVVVE